MIRSCTSCTPIKGGVRYYGVVLDEPIEGFQEWYIVEVSDCAKIWKLWSSVFNLTHSPDQPDATVVMEYRVVESKNTYEPKLKSQVERDRKLFKRR